MGTIVRWNIVERILGVMGKKTMEAIFPEKKPPLPNGGLQGSERP